MKFSVNWLGEFVELPESTEALAELLTLAGVEIEGVEKRGVKFENVVVAQITGSAPHPNADRLSVCQVNDGSGQTRQIVCGAKNYKVGDKVPLALPGAILTSDLKIRASKLRGVESEGMLCSEKELGLSEESAGLFILAPDAPIGAPIGTLFPSDTILDVEITPNRGDLLSHLGLAREIAALVRTPLRGAREVGRSLPASSGVEISALRECPFYSARRIEKVSVGPSPNWLRTKIEAVGVRSINNIVDIANLVMLELGQPLHAFDADKLKGGITVRLATEGEKFLALDGKTYSLGEGNLVIADAERAVAIAGVMGGEETGVTEATRNVLLESAYFLPASVRRTARSLSLPSDASYRFERGVDPEMILPASQRVTELIGEIAGGNPAKDVSVAGKLPASPASVSLSYAKCDQVLGIAIEPKIVDGILHRFGLHKNESSIKRPNAKTRRLKAVESNESGRKNRAEENATLVNWGIPTYRRDLQRDVDLIEEIVRAYGIDRIPGRDRSRFTPQSEADRAADFETTIRQRFVARGLFETRTSALIPRAEAATSNQGAIELKNPLSEEHVALRPSLTSGLLAVLARNQNMGATSVRIFELGRIFLPPDAREECALGLLFSGEAASNPHWRAPAKRHLDFFDLKGAIEALRIPELGLKRANHPAFALAAEITSSNEVIGLAGQLATARAAQLGAAAPVFLAQVNLESLLHSSTREAHFAELEKFPAVTRDVAMLVPEALPHSEVMDAIRSAQEPLLEKVALFDLFGGAGTQNVANVAEGRKSLAYTLTYRDQNRTLTHDEVSAAHDRIRERLQRELNAELRE
jgi:phenylalanyl-tRNA synthetase beta chain